MSSAACSPQDPKQGEPAPLGVSSAALASAGCELLTCSERAPQVAIVQNSYNHFGALSSCTK